MRRTSAWLATVALGASLGRAHAADEGPSRFVVSGAANAVLPSAGLELAWGLSDHLAVAVQGTTLLAHNDLSVRTRLHLGEGRQGFYVGASGHLIHSPLILSFPAWAGAGEVGYEWVRPTGWRLALEVGGGMLWAERAEGRDGWMFWPVVNVRVGR